MFKIHTSTVPHEPADRPDMSEWRVLVEFCMFLIQNWLFEVISRSFCIIFGQETHEHVKTIKKRCLEAKNLILVKMH